MIRPVHDDGVGARHVYAGLYDGGAHQQVEALVVEVRHDALKIALAHLAVGDADARLRHQLGEIAGALLDALHVVVQVVDLTAALQFPQHRLAHHRRLVLAHEGLDGEPLGGRGGDDGEIPHAGHRHVEGARDRGGGEGEDVHVGPQRLDLLLLAHPESVLLVDDEQPQILEGEVGAEQLVGAYDDVHLAIGQLLQDAGLLLGGAEAAQHLHPHRPVGEAIAEVVVVLLGQQGGGHQHGHLLAAVHRHEGRPHGHFGLAKAHIAAHQPVHALGLAHVAEHRIDGIELILGLLEREAGGKLAVALLVVLEGKAGPRRAYGIDIEQLGGHVAHLLRRLAPRLDPGLAAELVAGGVIRPRVTADEVEVGDRHEQLVATGVFQGEELGGQAAGIQGLEPEIAADPVIQMHHGLALGQLAEVADHRIRAQVLALLPLPLASDLAAEQLGLCDEGQGLCPGGFEQEAPLQRADQQAMTRLAPDELLEGGELLGLQLDPRQQIAEPLAPPLGLHREQGAAGKALQELAEGQQGLLLAVIELQVGQGGDGQVVLARAAVGGGLLQAHGTILAQRRKQLLHRQVNLLGRQQGAGIVPAPVFIALAYVVPEALGRRVDLPHGEQQGVVRQVVKQAGGLAEEERQIVFDAGGPAPLAHLLIDGSLRPRQLELLAELSAKQLDGGLVGGKFPGGQQAHRLDRLAGALALGIEGADGVHLVIEEVDAIGAAAAHGEEIQQGAAGGELAVLQHLLHRHIARLGQTPPQLLQVEALAAGHHQAVFVEIGLGRRAQHQGGDGHYQHAAAHLRQPVEGLEALGDDVLMGGEGVVGQGFPVREHQHRAALVGQQVLQLLFEAQGTRGIGSHQQDGAVGLPGEAGGNQRQAAADQLAQGQFLARFGGQGGEFHWHRSILLTLTLAVISADALGHAV
ncbi:hypothetical protein D3C72_328850 [compost metagenome]